MLLKTIHVFQSLFPGGDDNRHDHKGSCFLGYFLKIVQGRNLFNLNPSGKYKVGKLYGNTDQKRQGNHKGYCIPVDIL